MTWHEFIALEIREIERHKWIASEKAGRDLGDRAIFDWVEHHADAFRNYLFETLGETVCYPDGFVINGKKRLSS